jgi:hypothetical protein
MKRATFSRTAKGLAVTISGDGRPERSRLITPPLSAPEMVAAKVSAAAALLLAGYVVAG